MKIVLVGPAHPYRGGIAKFDDVLAQNLVSQGHEVHIMNFRLQYPSFLFPGKTQYTDSPAEYDIDSVRIVNSVNPFNWRRVVRRIGQLNADLVVMRYWMPFMAPCLGTIARGIRRKGIAVVAITDNVVPHEHHFYDRPMTRYFLNNIDRAVYMSAQVGKELQDFNFKGQAIFASHPIYDTYGQGVTRGEAASVLELDDNFGYVLFFGFIRDYKGLDMLLRAWQLLPTDKFKDKKLLVAGEFYGNRQKYIALIDELGIGQSVVLRDKYIEEERVRYYFSLADIVVQPYRSATQSGITQVAYNFGVPMVVTNVGGLAEIVPHGKVGYVVEVEPSAIAGALEDFYDNARGAKMRQNIVLEKERFSWRTMIKALMKDEK